MKENQLLIAGVAALVLIAGAYYYSASPTVPQGVALRQDSGQASTTSQEASGDVVSSAGIHWHPELSIVIKGQKQVVPADIGLGMQYAGYKYYDSMMMMANTHTHDASGMIHWEVMEGPVTKDELTLSAFFGIWGKSFNKNCIFDSCSGQGGMVKMFVNGKESTEFENYQVKDKDKIEIRYE